MNAGWRNVLGYGLRSIRRQPLSTVMAPTVVDRSRRCVDDGSRSTWTFATPNVVSVLTAYLVPPGTVSLTRPTSLLTVTRSGGAAKVQGDVAGVCRHVICTSAERGADDPAGMSGDGRVGKRSGQVHIGGWGVDVEGDPRGHGHGVVGGAIDTEVESGRALGGERGRRAGHVLRSWPCRAAAPAR